MTSPWLGLAARGCRRPGAVGALWLMAMTGATSFALWRPWGWDGTIPPKEIAWQLGAVGGLVLGLSRRGGSQMTQAGIGPLCLLPLLGLVSLALTGPIPIGMKLVMNLTLAVVGLWLAVQWVPVCWVRRVLGSLVVCALLQAAYGVLQLWRDPIFQAVDVLNRPGWTPRLPDRLFGFYGVPAHFAASLALAWPACWLWKGWAGRLSAALLALLIVLTRNCGALLGLGLAAAYLAWRWLPPRSWRLVAVAELAVLGWRVGVAPIDDGRRLAVWRTLLGVIHAHPWVGYGFGAFGDVVRIVEGQGASAMFWVHPHNEFLGLAIASGVVGLSVCAVSGLWLLTRLTWVKARGLSRSWPREWEVSLAGLLVFLVNAQVNYPCYVAPLAWAGWLYLWAMVGLSYEGEAASVRAMTVRAARLEDFTYARS